MPWTYSQRSGDVTDPTGQWFARGYSGHGIGLMNPDMEAVKGIGPLPRGAYSIGPAHTSIDLGPCVMNLDALAGTETHGRGDFRIHGDNRNGDHSASHGCVVLGKYERLAIAASLDRVLVVTL